MMKLPNEILKFTVSDKHTTSDSFVEAIVRDCANAALMALGGKSHKVSENSDTYQAQDHALATASKAILKRYGLD